MTALAGKIRQRVEDHVENVLDPQAAAFAVAAVLEIHKPDVQDGNVRSDGTCCLCVGYGPPVLVHTRTFLSGDLVMHGHMDVDNPVCAECGNVWEGEHVAWPCPTVIAIATALGIPTGCDHE